MNFSASTVIAITTIIISIMAFSNHSLMSKLILNPYSVKKFNEWYRLFSCALIHADWMHLIFNMLALWSFGRVVEYYYAVEFGGNGMIYFVLLYVGGQLFSVLPTYAKYKDFMAYNSLGASGAVSAIVFASILFEPWNPIYLFFIPIGIPAVIFGVAFLAISQYLSNRGGDNINHDAHFYGALFGLLFTIVMKFSILLDFFQKLMTPTLHN